MNPEKKLKLILASLKDREIIKYFEVFAAHFPEQFKKAIRQITFNCYEAVCEFKGRTATGYGKNSQ
jgi:activator of 2-hydroxyglutaryl-CoA dehydratase